MTTPSPKHSRSIPLAPDEINRQFLSRVIEATSRALRPIYWNETPRAGRLTGLFAVLIHFELALDREAGAQTR